MENEKLLAKICLITAGLLQSPCLKPLIIRGRLFRKSANLLLNSEKLLIPKSTSRGEKMCGLQKRKGFDSAYLGGPLIICEDAEIRQCAFIRGNAIVGRGAVVGNSTELKNSILLTVFRLRTITTSVTVFSATSHTQAQV